MESTSEAASKVDESGAKAPPEGAGIAPGMARRRRWRREVARRQLRRMATGALLVHPCLRNVTPRGVTPLSRIAEEEEIGCACLFGQVPGMAATAPLRSRQVANDPFVSGNHLWLGCLFVAYRDVRWIRNIAVTVHCMT